MQPQHSCSTLESRNKIFSCTVQELYTTGGHHPLQSLSNALVTAETHCVATPQSPLF